MIFEFAVVAVLQFAVARERKAIWNRVVLRRTVYVFPPGVDARTEGDFFEGFLVIPASSVAFWVFRVVLAALSDPEISHSTSKFPRPLVSHKTDLPIFLRIVVANPAKKIGGRSASFETRLSILMYRTPARSDPVALSSLS